MSVGAGFSCARMLVRLSATARRHAVKNLGREVMLASTSGHRTRALELCMRAPATIHVAIPVFGRWPVQYSVAGCGLTPIATRRYRVTVLARVPLTSDLKQRRWTTSVP